MGCLARCQRDPCGSFRHATARLIRLVRSGLEHRAARGRPLVRCARVCTHRPSQAAKHIERGLTRRSTSHAAACSHCMVGFASLTLPREPAAACRCVQVMGNFRLNHGIDHRTTSQVPSRPDRLEGLHLHLRRPVRLSRSGPLLVRTHITRLGPHQRQRGLRGTGVFDALHGCVGSQTTAAKDHEWLLIQRNPGSPALSRCLRGRNPDFIGYQAKQAPAKKFAA